MRALRKGQGGAFNIARDIRDEACIVERAFGLAASALSEVAHCVRQQMELGSA